MAASASAVLGGVSKICIPNKLINGEDNHSKSGVKLAGTRFGSRRSPIYSKLSFRRPPRNLYPIRYLAAAIVVHRLEAMGIVMLIAAFYLVNLFSNYKDEL